MKFLKNVVLKITPSRIKSILGTEEVSRFKNTLNYSKLSYSQEGEDLILARFFGNKKNGFYVDVGAHHPRKFSNTYIFYKKGWKGINIDDMPNSMDVFKTERSRDINLEIGVSKEQDELVYYMFNQPALNTFSEVEAKKKLSIEKFKVIGTKKITTLPLKLILEQHLPKDTKIDFLTIDVEGLDIEVIQSNDWETYRPTMVVVEDLNKAALAEIHHTKVFKELSKNGYELIAKTYNTLFFKDTRGN